MTLSSSLSTQLILLSITAESGVSFNVLFLVLGYLVRTMSLKSVIHIRSGGNVDHYCMCKNAQEMLVAGGGTLLCIVFLLVSSSPQLAESATGPLDELTRSVGPAEQNGQGKQTSHSGSTFERTLDLWNTLRDGFMYRLETRVHTKIFLKAFS